MHPLDPPVQGIGHIQLHIDALFLAIGTLESLASFGKIAQAPTWNPQRDYFLYLRAVINVPRWTLQICDTFCIRVLLRSTSPRGSPTRVRVHWDKIQDCIAQRACCLGWLALETLVCQEAHR